MSNRLTFSLASLILILGLVFVPTSVMAHPHVDIPDTEADESVPDHNSHPEPVISLKPDAADAATEKVRNNQVVIGEAPASSTAGVDANEFVLIIDFGRDVTTNAASKTANPEAVAPLIGDVTADFAGIVLNANGGNIGTDLDSLTINAATVVAMSNSTFEVLVAVSQPAVPATSGGPVEVRLRLNALADVFSLAMLPSDAIADVPGGASLQSELYTFTLVSSLSPLPDTTAPTVEVTAPDEPNTDGNLEFTFDFNEALATTGDHEFTLGDIDVEGGSPVDFAGPDADNDYVLEVKPDADAESVTVSITGVVGDGTNTVDISDASDTYDNTPPTVTITAPTAPLTAPAADAGKLVFTFVFSEPIDSTTFTSEDIAGEDYVVTDAPAMDATDTTGKTYTAKVKPTSGDDGDDVTVVLNAGTVNDVAGNPLAEGQFARYTPTVSNRAPTFVTEMADFGLCKGDTLTRTDGKVLPLAEDEPGDQLTYTIDPNTPLPAGLRVERVDLQTRRILGTATVAQKTSHNWIVTDEHGLTATETFTIDVKEHQKPEKPTGLMATKVDSAAISAAPPPYDPKHNRVTLTWPQPADKSAYPDCIPAVTSYTVSQTKKDEVSGTYPESSLVTYSYTADMERFRKPTTATEEWIFTTPYLANGIYKFSIVAHNSAPDSPSVASDDAVWDKTMLMEVVVADPPAAPESLEGAIDQDGNQITLNWLKVPDADDGGAPIDDFGVYKANTKYGGYVIYQVRDEDQKVTRYPATGTLNIENYEHPTWQTPDLDPGQYVFRVTAMNIAGESPRSLATREFTIISSGTRPPVVGGTPATKATYANGVTSITEGTIPGNGFFVITANALPDIQRFFAEGGTISVLNTSGTSKDVVISEIMWGLDLRQAVGAGRKDKQFIELYNTTGAPINLATVTIEFNKANTVPAVPAGKVLIDQISNVSGVGWLITEAPGQSGSLAVPGDPAAFVPTNLISMYRNIDYARVTKSDHNADAAKNREEQLKGVPGGNALGSWAASNPADTYGINLIGSPGAQHFVAYKKLDPTNVARDQFIINEIGNNTGDKYDWVEIKRVGSNNNLKKWRLSQVTDDKKDTALVSFPDNNNHLIPNNGDVLLIVNSDPHEDPDHPLAAGDRINGGHEEKTGTTSRYYVDSGLKLKDNGKTLLILRNSIDNGHLGKSNNIQDVVGTLGITDNSAGFRTSLWPLVATGKPHGDVVNDDAPTDYEDFRAGHVYVRTGDKKGTVEHSFNSATYTGVGYKRSAAKGNQNGGTPGYDNGAVKVNDADLASDATVSISEIMYTKGRNLPQWIELYNSSMTQAVNLAEWKLRIEHSRDVDDVDIRYPSVTTNNLGGVIIPPNQTVLIVSSTTGRTSRAAQGDVDFPAARIIDLWAQKDRLEIPSSETRRTYKLLSETAFKITLLDKSGAAVDIAGNLGDDGTAMWDLPTNDDEGRSSIIRRYNTGSTTRGGGGLAMDGTLPAWNDQGLEGDAGWIYAAASGLREIRAETYYGSDDDQGTPGYRGGGPLPVSLSKFRPERLDDGSIRIAWVTESELNNAGFNILRSEERDGEFKQINTKLIAGQGTTSERTTYTHIDTSAKPNVVYYYQIQDVSLDGQVQTLRQSRLKGHISAAGKATTTWGELKALQ